MEGGKESRHFLNHQSSSSTSTSLSSKERGAIDIIWSLGSRPDVLQLILLFNFALRTIQRGFEKK
jgi:hypothetical protein